MSRNLISRALNPAKYAVAADVAGDRDAAIAAYSLSVQVCFAKMLSRSLSAQFLSTVEVLSSEISDEQSPDWLSETQRGRITSLIEVPLQKERERERETTNAPSCFCA